MNCELRHYADCTDFPISGVPDHSMAFLPLTSLVKVMKYSKLQILLQAFKFLHGVRGLEEALKQWAGD